MINFFLWLEYNARARAWLISPEGQAYSGYSHEEIAEEQIGVPIPQLMQQNWAQISTFSNGRASFHQNMVTPGALRVAQGVFRTLNSPVIEAITKGGYKDFRLEDFLDMRAADLNTMSRNFASAERGAMY